MEPLVCIILVNYQGYTDTVACVESLLKINYKNCKIIIVENASSDTEKMKNDRFLNQNAEILYAKENKGFSGGNNIGIQYAMRFLPDYVLLLNNDTVVEPDFLDELVKTSEKNDNIGIVTGKIYYYDMPTEGWYFGGIYDRCTGKTNQTVFDQSVKDEKEITFASGCLMLIAKKCIQRVGMLDDNYFMYSEDSDYCCRVQNAGMKMMWNPNSIIYHKVSSSVGNNSIFQQYYMTRNNFIMIQKYGNHKIRAYLCRLLSCGKDIIKGRMKLKIMIWAFYDFLKGSKGISDRTLM